MKIVEAILCLILLCAPKSPLDLTDKTVIESKYSPEVNSQLGTYKIDLRPIVPKAFVNQDLNNKNVNLYILKNGDLIENKRITEIEDLILTVYPDEIQNDYSFFIEDGDTVFTGVSPTVLGDPTSSQLKKVEYVQKNTLTPIRARLLNNIVYVQKKDLGKKTIKIEKVRLIRNDNGYKVEIFLLQADGSNKKITTSLFNDYVWIKFDDCFNKNAFFWDDQIISWFALETDPEISKSTLDFWYSLQITSGPNLGLIPREIRPENYSQSLASFRSQKDIFSPLSFHLLSSLQINNPFLLGRIELELYDKEKDIKRLKRVLPKLIDYYNWVEKHRKKEIQLQGKKISVYAWSNPGSGMDNAPRCENLGEECGYSDLIAQQAALAKDISKIAQILGKGKISSLFASHFQDLANQIQSFYLDPESGFIYDIRLDGSLIKDVQTISFIWSLYSGALTTDSAKRLLTEFVDNENKFGGDLPMPTLARDSQYYSKDGNYWRGGIWPPLIWISYLGLKEYNFNSGADNLAIRYYQLFKSTFDYYGTLFEYYEPVIVKDDVPHMTYGKDPPAKDNFFGWSILPLKLLSSLDSKW